jgi:hypothetical protein
MNKLKENIKDIFTDLIGAALILTAITLYLFDEIDLTKGGIVFVVGVAFFFIPDDILSQMTQKFVNKKLDKDSDKPA